MKTKIFLPFSLLISLFLLSCEKNKDEQVAPPSMKGIFVVNEGAFGNGNAGITFIPSDGSSIIPDLFENVNAVPLGDIAQSMSIWDDRAFIVVNNSQKTEVVSMSDFHSLGKITGLSSPRYFAGLTANKAYISDWISNDIKIINLDNYTVTGSIPAGNGPDQMLVYGNYVYVCNVGGFGNDSSVMVINHTNDQVIDTIPTGMNPNSIQLDADGFIWVLCGGSIGPDWTPGTSDDTGGSLIKINPSGNTVMSRIDLNSDQHPIRLRIYNDELYYLSGTGGYTGKPCRMNKNSGSFNYNSFIDREFYGFDIDHSNGRLYTGNPNFSFSTYIFRYENNGSLIDSIPAGVGPNGFLFNF